jgi:hypothetical protein
MNTTVAQLPFEKKLLFGLCLAQRLIHLIEDFDLTWEESFSPIASSALSSMYEAILNDDNFNILVINDQLVQQIPSSEEYEGNEAVLAQNAGIALLSCAKFYLSHELRYLEECMSKVEETLDFRAIVINGGGDEESDFAIEKESIIQQRLLGILEEMPAMIDSSSIATIRNFAKTNIIKIDN